MIKPFEENITMDKILPLFYTVLFIIIIIAIVVVFGTETKIDDEDDHDKIDYQRQN